MALYLASIVHSRFRRFGVRLVEFKILKGPDFFSNITRFQNAYLDYPYNTLVYKLYCSLLIDTKLLAIFFPFNGVSLNSAYFYFLATFCFPGGRKFKRLNVCEMPFKRLQN